MCKALNIDRSLSGKDLFGRELYIENNEDDDFEVVVDKRVNIDYAEEDKDKLWRFYIKDNKYVSVIKRQWYNLIMIIEGGNLWRR